jgi:hypothetical protein
MANRLLSPWNAASKRFELAKRQNYWEKLCSAHNIGHFTNAGDCLMVLPICLWRAGLPALSFVLTVFAMGIVLLLVCLGLLIDAYYTAVKEIRKSRFWYTAQDLPPAAGRDSDS